MAKIAHVAEKETYDAGQYIVREKSVGDTFYIIVRGSCDVFQLQSNNTQKLINKLKAGEHFGEKALLNDNDLRNDIYFVSILWSFNQQWSYSLYLASIGHRLGGLKLKWIFSKNCYCASINRCPVSYLDASWCH